MIMSIEDLTDKVKKTFQYYGVPTIDAGIAAKCMVLADVYGISTHGTIVLPSHIKRIKQNGYNLNPELKIIKQSLAYTIIDADNAIGFVSATHCMEKAIEKAKESGIHTVFSRNSNAYGAACCYPIQAARQGMIGCSFCNSPAAMAPFNGKEKRLGTNPLSVVFPTNIPEKPIIIDMATSKVAKSKFLQAKREGRNLPDGWALNKDGYPTNNPDEAIQGFVLPMEGFKGFALALSIDIIAGLLSGAAYQDHVGRFYDESGAAMNVGQVFIAINPELFGEPYEYCDIICKYIENMRKCKTIDQQSSIILPGDDKLKAYDNAIHNGIEVSNEVIKIIL